MALPVPSSSIAASSSSSQAIVGSLLHEKYLVVRNIGAGNFGCCWLVHDTSDKDSPRAVKQVYVGTAVSAKDASRAESEAHLLSQLRHPHIVTFYECFVAGGFLSIVTEYCDGGDLAHVIALRTGLDQSDPPCDQSELVESAAPRYFSEAQIISWLVQLTLALEYMHGKRILHRDVKSGNVFLRTDNDKNMIKLGDFGIAKALSGTLDNATSIAGTPYYMSPECIQGKGYNAKSDIWALGMIAYELCLLQHPFKGQSLMGLMYKICEEQFDIEIPDVYSADLANVMAQLFARDPMQRPSASQILRLPYVKQCIIDTIDGGGSAQSRISLSSTPEVLANSMLRSNQLGLSAAQASSALPRPSDAASVIDNIRRGRRQKIQKMKENRLAAHATRGKEPVQKQTRAANRNASGGGVPQASVAKKGTSPPAHNANKPVDRQHQQHAHEDTTGNAPKVQPGHALGTVVVEGSTIGLSPRARLRLKKQQEADRRARELTQLAEAQAGENARRYTAEKHRLHTSDWSPTPSPSNYGSSHLQSPPSPSMVHRQSHSPGRGDASSHNSVAVSTTDVLPDIHRLPVRNLTPGPIAATTGCEPLGDSVHDRYAPQLRDIMSPSPGGSPFETAVFNHGRASRDVHHIVSNPKGDLLSSRVARESSRDTVNQLTTRFAGLEPDSVVVDTASDASLESGSGSEGSMWGDSDGDNSAGYSDDQFEDYADSDGSEVDSNSEDEFISCLQDALSMSRSSSCDPVRDSWSSNEVLLGDTPDQTTIRDPYSMGVDMTDLDNVTQPIASETHLLDKASTPFANVTQPLELVTGITHSVVEPVPDEPVAAFGGRGTGNISADARKLLGDGAFETLHEYVYQARTRRTPDAIVQRYFHKNYADHLQACFLVDQLVYHEMYPASGALC